MECFYHIYQENSICHDTAWKMTAKKSGSHYYGFETNYKNKNLIKKTTEILLNSPGLWPMACQILDIWVYQSMNE